MLEIFQKVAFVSKVARKNENVFWSDAKNMQIVHQK